MNAFDIAVLVLTGGLVLVGFVKGLVRTVVSLITLVVAFFVAGRFHQTLADHWVDHRPSSPPLRLIAFLVLFLLVLLAGALVVSILRKAVRAASLGWLDRLAGAAVGFVVAVLACALLILPVVAYTPQGETLLGHSTLVPYIAAMADLANRVVPGELARRYRERIRELRRRWQEAQSDIVQAVPRPGPRPFACG